MNTEEMGEKMARHLGDTNVRHKLEHWGHKCSCQGLQEAAVTAANHARIAKKGFPPSLRSAETEKCPNGTPT